MAAVYFLVLLLVVLLIYTMISTFIKASLYLTTGVNYENSRLVIPVILSILIWFIVGSLYILTINNYIHGNIINEVFEYYLQKKDLLPILEPSILIFILFIVIGIFLQSFTYFSVNIKLEDIFNLLRYKIKKKLNIGLANNKAALSIFNEIPNLSIFTAFVTSLLATVMILISTILLFYLGIYMASRLHII